MIRGGTSKNRHKPMPEGNWREIEGHPNYMVSDDGRVWSRVVRRVLKPYIHQHGYSLQMLNGKNCRIHRLVAEAFLPDRAGPHVRHLDGNPANNRVENLAWGTVSENMTDTMRHGRQPRALAPDVVRQIRASVKSSRQTAAQFNTNHRTVQSIWSGAAYGWLE